MHRTPSISSGVIHLAWTLLQAGFGRPAEKRPEPAAEDRYEPAPREVPTVAKLPSPRPCDFYRVAVVGDSIVESYDHFYPNLLNEALVRNCVEVRGFGRTSDTLRGFMGQEPIQGVTKDRLDWVLSGGLEELVIAMGVNDIAAGVTPEKMIGSLAEICERAMDAGVRRIVLVEVAPWGGSPRWNEERQQETLEYNRMLGELACELNFDFTLRGCDTEVEVVRIYRRLEAPYYPGYSMYPRISAGRVDRVHPSQEGLMIIAQEIVRQAYSEFMK